MALMLENEFVAAARPEPTWRLLLDLERVSRCLPGAEVAARTAVVAVEGREIHGQGSASARIRSTLAAEGDATRVRVETEINVTGRPAQFGRGIMQDVATKMLTDFADCPSRTLDEAPETDAAPAPAAALDLAPAVGGVLAARIRIFLHRLLHRAA
jgi:carbon monoxide dehydrogenase subunit G